MIEEAIVDFLAPLSAHAPLLAFAISFIGSLLIFIPVPYFPLLSVLALTYEPISLILASSLGSALAKLIIFMMGYWGGKKVSERRRERMKPLIEIVKKYGWLAAFIAAATPIPDDMVYIPLGLLRYKPSYFLISTFLGKIIINGIIILGSRWTLPIIFRMVEEMPSEYWLPGAIAFIVITILLVYLVLFVDWNKVFEKFGYFKAFLAQRT